MVDIRRCGESENEYVVAVINAAARKYKGVIPDDRWHEPYMTFADIEHEIAAGVAFWGIDVGGRLAGVMGHQHVRDAELIRHAYVLPEFQGTGIGGRLLRFMIERRRSPMLVGTWMAATWAIRFYQRHGFVPVPGEEVPALLRRYWSVPERQIETSVVLRYAA